MHQVLTGIGDVKLDSEFKETAGFANATYYFSPRFDVSFGGRYSTNDQDALQGGTLAPAAHRTSTESVFTYSVAPRLRVNEDTMIYARIAKGYRPGGPNAIPPAAPPGVPVTYGADNLINYEAGVKSDIGEKISVDVSAFFIDWSDIQLLTIVSGFGVNGNGGTAESKGFEWSIDYRPASNLNLAFTGAYTDATLTADTHPLVGGHAGDELPYAAKWSMMVSGDFNYPICSGMGYAGASLRYVGDRLDNFNTTFGRLLIPSHNEVDLRTGIDWEQLSLQLYAKNITDERGIMGFQSTLSPTSGGSPGIGGQGATVIQPRSIGASLTARF